MYRKKLAKEEECAFPEIKDCNGEGNEKRCIYMKYNNKKSIDDPTRWECTYKKESATKSDFPL